MSRKSKLVILVEFLIIVIAFSISVFLLVQNCNYRENLASEIRRYSVSVSDSLHLEENEKIQMDDHFLADLVRLEQCISIYQNNSSDSNISSLDDLVYWTKRMVLEIRSSPEHENLALGYLKSLGSYYQFICYNSEGELYPQNLNGFSQGLENLAMAMNGSEFEKLYNEMVNLLH